MIQRCVYKGGPDFRRYGGRGISICDRWMEFLAFLEDMGERPLGTTLERIANDGNYDPGNCRWATRKDQAANRCSSRIITVDGRRDALAIFASEYGIDPKIVRKRIDELGWETKAALTKPFRRTSLSK